MDLVGVAARIVLGAAFVVAGGSKLALGRTWPAQARSLGAPEWSIGPLPWGEIILGAAVVVGLGGAASVWAAIAVLVAFSVLLVDNLRRGRRPPCACFGAWSSAPLGWRHVARNAALVAAGAVSLAA